jgi:hypothetical protein
MLRCWRAFPDVSKDRSALVFKVSQFTFFGLLEYDPSKSLDLFTSRHGVTSQKTTPLQTAYLSLLCAAEASFMLLWFGHELASIRKYRLLPGLLSRSVKPHNFVTSYGLVDRNNSVGIATRYGLDGPGIEFR